jgi:speckle-type POZ protein
MAHKAVLAAKSQFFAAMFALDMRESIENRVEIKDIEVQVFEEFLSFL